MTTFRKVYNHATLVALLARHGRAIDRRSSERPLDPVVDTYAETCRRAGAQFIGIQEGVAEAGLESLVMFNNPEGSTLAVPVSKFNHETVAERLRGARQ